MGNQSPHDIVVIGATAGGVGTQLNLNKALPRNFPSSFFAVVHFPAFNMSVLPDILNREGNLPATHAEDGENFNPGQIYVAPTNSHLVFNDHTLILDRGPREHGFRPAIDTLFRSAASEFGERVIGVILSGILGDGVAGLLAINRTGGNSVVQEPREPLFAEMPNRAIENAEVEDDGIGFNVPERWATLVLQGHLGMANAAERAEILGGQFHVDSAPGNGTIVRVTIPASV